MILGPDRIRYKSKNSKCFAYLSENNKGKRSRLRRRIVSNRRRVHIIGQNARQALRDIGRTYLDYLSYSSHNSWAFSNLKKEVGYRKFNIA